MIARHHRLKKARCRIAAMVIFEFLAVISIAAVCTIPAGADMFLMAYLGEGAAVHNGTHICMPEAHVRVNITRTAYVMLTSMRAEFHLSTNTTQNVTLGFIPPVIGSWGEDSYSHLAIALNGSEIEYTVLTWEDLGVEQGFATALIDALGTWVESAEYDVFNMEMQANSTAIILVTSSTAQTLDVDGVEYEYVIASARTFEGDTHEIVHIQLVEETPFLSVQFSPVSYLTLTEEGKHTDAIWDFNVSAFENVSVRMNAMVRELTGTIDPTTTSTTSATTGGTSETTYYVTIGLFGITAFVVAVAVIILAMRRQREVS